MSGEPAPRFRLALLVSVALNLLLAAALVVLWLAPQRGGDAIGMSPVRMPHPHMLRRVLPPADREILDQVLARHRPEIHKRLPPLHEARRELHDALAAEPLDSARVDDALARVRKREAAAAAAVQDMLRELAARVSPQGRHALIAALALRGGHDRHRDRRRDAREPDEAPEG